MQVNVKHTILQYKLVKRLLLEHMICHHAHTHAVSLQSPQFCLQCALGGFCNLCAILTSFHCWCSPAVNPFTALLVAPFPPPPHLPKTLSLACAVGHDRSASNDLGLCSRPDPLQSPSDPHQTHHETVLQKDLTAHLGSDCASLHHPGCLHAAAEGPGLVPWCQHL